MERKVLENLLDWFEREGRNYKWRETKDIFVVLISELLLAKSESDRVEKAVRRIVNKWPSAGELKLASLSEISDCLYSIGLQNKKAKYMKQASEHIHRSKKDEIHNSLKKQELPGIGEYGSNAVRALVFGDSTAFVDNNSMRVLAREEEGLEPEEISSQIEEKLVDSLREQAASRLTEACLALIDLGAIVCTRAEPSCEACPLREDCRYVADEES